jgi:hypothetical protein
MQTRPEMPPATAPAPPQQAADDARVARILARSGRRQSPALAQEVKAALAEFEAPAAADPAAPPAPPPRRSRDEPAFAIRRWQRLALALVAAALVVLLWHRLAWIG